MKAITHTRFGSADVLTLSQVDTPVPGDGDVLVNVHASTVTSGDVKVRGFEGVPWTMVLLARPMFGFRTPRQPILGSEFAGVVAAVGKDVTTFKPGDRVFGMLGMKLGANAEYVCIPAKNAIAHMPAGRSFTEMASMPFGALTALHFLTVGKIAAGDHVLINGASGAVGVAAIQIAKHVGATVTSVCSSKNVDLVMSLGADHVIDYTQQDVTQTSQTYDIIFDTVGKITFGQAKRMLKPNGRYLQAVFAIRHLFQMMFVNMTGNRKMICTVAPESPTHLQALKQLVEDGQYKAVIDRVYPLEQTADAHRYVDGGHKVGSVVIDVVQD